MNGTRTNVQHYAFSVLRPEGRIRPIFFHSKYIREMP